MQNLIEDFLVHDQLNPKIWDTAGLLLPEVRTKIIEIVKAFEDLVTVPLDIVDVLLVGSNAGYNYTDTSDLDVHIIANFEVLSNDIDLVKNIYDLNKTIFNKNHEISIHGLPIELYVLDINSACISNGIYSVLDNKWIKEPKPMTSASKKNIEKELEAWREHILLILNDPKELDVLDAINTLYLIRHNAVAAEGEYSKGNQLFKAIRSEGLLDRLKDEYTKLVDKRLTLESFNKGYSNGQLINRDVLDEGMTYTCTCDVIKPDDTVIHWKSLEYATSKEKALNSMKYHINLEYGYKVYIRNINIVL